MMRKLGILLVRRHAPFAAEFPYDSDDLVRMEGLLHDATARHRAWCSGRVARGIDDRQFRIVLAAPLRDLPSIDLSGQPDVVDQHVRGVTLALGQRLLACARA